VLGQEATGRVITVEDEGPGVAEADAERIFEMYMTEAGSESGGTGVGLPLSRRLARLLGGNLRVIPSPNKGARFQLDLPG
jgi:signal transduction histidine kinase